MLSIGGSTSKFSDIFDFASSREPLPDLWVSKIFAIVCTRTAMVNNCNDRVSRIYHPFRPRLDP
jgi:hypothetical protein